MTPDQKRSNFKFALVLLSVALVFGLGFVFKLVVLGA